MIYTPIADQPGFVAKEPEHCHACYRPLPAPPAPANDRAHASLRHMRPATAFRSHLSQGSALEETYTSGFVDLDQSLKRPQGAQVLGLLTSVSEVQPHDLSDQIGDAPAFSLGNIHQGLVLLGLKQKLRSI